MRQKSLNYYGAEYISEDNFHFKFNRMNSFPQTNSPIGIFCPVGSPSATLIFHDLLSHLYKDNKHVISRVIKEFPVVLTKELVLIHLVEYV